MTVALASTALTTHPLPQKQQEKAETCKVDSRAQHAAAAAEELGFGGDLPY